jgi:hypothetical protein
MQRTLVKVALAAAFVMTLAVCFSSTADAAVTVESGPIDLVRVGNRLEGAVLVTNDGAATTAHVTGLKAGGSFLCDATKKQINIPASSETFVHFTLKADCARAKRDPILHVTVTSPAAAIDRQTTRKEQPSGSPRWNALAVCLGVGLGLGLVGAIATRAFSGRREGTRTGPPSDGDLLPGVETASWKFSDSWATNLVAVGALLATVLSATDLLDLLIDDSDTAVFLTVNLFALGLVAVAPLIVSGLQREYSSAGDNSAPPDLVATVNGLAIAGGVTLAGVTMQLTALFLLFVFGDVVPDWLKWVSGFGFALGAVIAFGYAVRTLVQVIKVGRFVPEESVDVVSGQALVGVMNIAGPEGEVPLQIPLTTPSPPRRRLRSPIL